MYRFKHLSRHLLAERLSRTSVFTKWELNSIGFVRLPGVSPVLAGIGVAGLGPRPSPFPLGPGSDVQAPGQPRAALTLACDCRGRRVPP